MRNNGSTNILDTINRRTGMEVPAGYFDDFARRMSAALPEQPWETEEGQQAEQPRTIWQRVRPYVYMAAMFAGIWLMMQMFDQIAPSRVDLSFSNNPVLTEAMNNDTFFNECIIDEMTPEELYDQMVESGATLTDYESIVDEQYDESANATTEL